MRFLIPNGQCASFACRSSFISSSARFASTARCAPTQVNWSEKFDRLCEVLDEVPEKPSTLALGIPFHPKDLAKWRVGLQIHAIHFIFVAEFFVDERQLGIFYLRLQDFASTPTVYFFSLTRKSIMHMFAQQAFNENLGRIPCMFAVLYLCIKP